MEQHTQEEAEIVEKLRQFQPTPSAQAYTRMAQMSWNTNGEHTIMNRFLRSRTAKTTVAGLVAVLMMGIVVWSTPSLRTLAQEFIETLFNRAESDTTVVEYNTAPPSATISASVAQSFSTIAELEAAIGHDVIKPSIAINGYQVMNAAINYENQTVWLSYTAPGRNLSIYQRDASLGWLSEREVGASAEIIAVEITRADGTVLHGEYVNGGWWIDADSTDATPTGENTVQQPAEWTNNITQRVLRWQDENQVYEMVSFGGSGDTPDIDILLDRMIEIAASME